MLRRMNNESTYLVDTERAQYAVNICRRKNGINGNPRYTARVITLSVHGEKHYGNYLFTRVFNFDGHYLSEEDECKFIVNHVENTMNEY